jgi:hypothetical protein
MKIPRKFKMPLPDLQIDFAKILTRIREEYLQQALLDSVSQLDIQKLDSELSEYAKSEDVALLAGKGLRGELLFITPYIITATPRLLAYYRLLLGYSQKSFYGTDCKMGALKSLEEKGSISSLQEKKLPGVCAMLNFSASALLHGIGIDRISSEFLDDLTLLTLGPQLRGGANVRRGELAIVQVFDVIKKIVSKATKKISASSISLINSAGREVRIEFAPDPDIVIREVISSKSLRNIIAIEIKGGMDFSNIHNRIGEAEKSHQKARQAGYIECWTVVNVKRIDIKKAHEESPSTNRFFQLSDIISNKGDLFEDFKSRFSALTGIPYVSPDTQ